MAEPEMEAVSEEALLRTFFRALSDEQRLQIAGLLVAQPQSLAELAGATGIEPKRLMRHVEFLQESGFVRVAEQSGSPRYELDTAYLREMKTRILARTPGWTPELAEDAADWQRKVLQDFFDDGRLTAIPAQRKRRLIVYQWLVERFDPGVEYPEFEVNERLSVYHPDYALLRRELVDEGLMERDHGIYMRVNRDEG